MSLRGLFYGGRFSQSGVDPTSAGGLDIGEHGMEAYAGFQIFSNQ